MPTTACTDNFYNTVVVGYQPGTGDTVGPIVTFKTPKPEWTDSSGNRTIICSAVALGGFNGLNS